MSSEHLGTPMGSANGGGSQPSKSPFRAGLSVVCPVDPVSFHEQKHEFGESTPFRFPVSVRKTCEEDAPVEGHHRVAGKKVSHYSPLPPPHPDEVDAFVPLLAGSPSRRVIAPLLRIRQSKYEASMTEQSALSPDVHASPQPFDFRSDGHPVSPLRGLADQSSLPIGVASSPKQFLQSSKLDRMRKRHWAMSVGAGLDTSESQVTKARLLEDDSDSENEAYIAKKSLRRGYQLHSMLPSELEADISHSNLYGSHSAAVIGDQSVRLEFPGGEGPSYYPTHPTLEQQIPSGIPKFEMPCPPPPLMSDNSAKSKSRFFNWQQEPGFEIVLSLLLQRGVDPSVHYDIIDYHMAPEFLADIQALMRGDYFVRFSRKGGQPHERFCKIGLLQPKPNKEPEACLTWRVHQNSLTPQDRVSLANLVGVSFDSKSDAFQKFKIYEADEEKPYRHHIKPRQMKILKAQRQLALQRDAAEPQRIETLSAVSSVGLPQPLHIEGPLIGHARPQQLNCKNAFTLWFLDRRQALPKSLDVVTYKRETAVRWVNAMRGILAVNSLSIGSESAESQARMLRWVQMELEKDESEGIAEPPPDELEDEEDAYADHPDLPVFL